MNLLRGKGKTPRGRSRYRDQKWLFIIEEKYELPGTNPGVGLRKGGEVDPTWPKVRKGKREFSLGNKSGFEAENVQRRIFNINGPQVLLKKMSVLEHVSLLGNLQWLPVAPRIRC